MMNRIGKFEKFLFSFSFLLFSVSGFCADPVDPNLHSAQEDRNTVRGMVREILHDMRLQETQQLPSGHVITLYDEGFLFIGEDDKLTLSGWYQGDLRVPQANHPQATRFLNRRARLDARGVLEQYFGFRLMGEFAGANAQLQEGWLEYNRWPYARLRIGQYKEPFSLESQYSSLWIDFVETSLIVSNLQPAEDIGAMFFGNVFDKAVVYTIGIFNGIAKNAAETNDDKDLASRIVIQPFSKSESNRLKDLYLGGSVTVGVQQNNFAGATFTTALGTPFLTFSAATLHNGTRTRTGGEVEWLVGPASLKSEYIASRFEHFEMGSGVADFWAQGWYLSATCFLTGEKKSRNKFMVPKEQFAPFDGKWGLGAWEVAARFEQFFVDPEFIGKGFARGTDQVDAVTAGTNWWPNKHIKMAANYVYSRFDHIVGTSGTSLNDEHVFLSRFQFHF
ncbi:MAG: hypothetical protein HY391_05420 [Deltaproteobacteria bacterium]|nr:hypothetical protein [Deltaproteobacteria bacterium]